MIPIAAKLFNSIIVLSILYDMPALLAATDPREVGEYLEFVTGRTINSKEDIMQALITVKDHGMYPQLFADEVKRTMRGLKCEPILDTTAKDLLTSLKLPEKIEVTPIAQN